MARYLSRAELSCIAGKYIEMYYALFGISKNDPAPINPEQFANSVLGLNLKMLPLCSDGHILGLTVFQRCSFTATLEDAHFHSHCYIDQSFLAESSGLFLLKTFVHHTSYGCMVWFTNAKQANIRRETYTSQLMKGGHFTMNLPLFISSANFLLMKSLLLVLFRGLCSLLRLTAQQKIN